ncbi:MAG: hypothetical protein H6735_34185 [Alphaproteobacteria bacterium]|nr:hypothetical protein [Alphaproteobacteria bacterium]
MASFVVIYDACVLYPAQLRDLLLRVAHTGVVRARWTDDILDECFRALKRNRPDLDDSKLARTRSLICGAVDDSMVTGHRRLIDSVSGDTQN